MIRVISNCTRYGSSEKSKVKGRRIRKGTSVLDYAKTKWEADPIQSQGRRMAPHEMRMTAGTRLGRCISR